MVEVEACGPGVLDVSSEPIAIDSAPGPGLGLTVVIPCRDEPRVLDTLDSLWSAKRPRCDVETIVVINASEDDDDSVGMRNTCHQGSGLRMAS